MQWQTQDLQGSRRSLLKAKSLEPKPDPTTSGILGHSYIHTGDPVSAEYHYRAAVELQPEIRDWWIGLTRSLKEQGREVEAEETLKHIEARFGKIPGVTE